MRAVFALTLLLAEPAQPSPNVHLRIDQDGGLSTVQLQHAIDEVQKIWSDAGVVVRSGRYGEPHRELVDATISMRVLLTAPRVAHGARPILAWVTPGGSGRTAPLLFVSLPAVTEFVLRAEAFKRPVSTLTQALRDRLLAQAVGRVAAHELGHYLLQSAGHHRQGLMRPNYSANELVGDWLDPFKVPAAERMAVHREIGALARLQVSTEQ
jgi:hypothetical protein